MVFLAKIQTRNIHSATKKHAKISPTFKDMTQPYLYPEINSTYIVISSKRNSMRKIDFLSLQQDLFAQK